MPFFTPKTLSFRSTISNVAPIVYFFLFLAAVLFWLFIRGLSWMIVHKEEIFHAMRSPHTVRNKDDSDTAIAERIVEAIHSSVKRYKQLYQSTIANTFYWTAHSKRYVLRISLAVISRNKFLLSVALEGNHQQNFTLQRPGWLSS